MVSCERKDHQRKVQKMQMRKRRLTFVLADFDGAVADSRGHTGVGERLGIVLEGVLKVHEGQCEVRHSGVCAGDGGCQ